MMNGFHANPELQSLFFKGSLGRKSPLVSSVSSGKEHLPELLFLSPGSFWKATRPILSSDRIQGLL
ncbi:hypothetical protein ABH19_03505 [Leptospirillum sp. Group II 'CF-1']|nr:hypothetical protein ABH19_03505 [Leptospirillum sp. Group II 'CF-1']